MALVQCKECKSQISNTATTCPQCGAKVPKKTSRATWLIVGLLALLFSLPLMLPKSDAPQAKSTTAAAAPETPKPSTKRDLQLRAGGAGAMALKNAAKDPESFTLQSAVVKENGTTCYDYRAKNSFGAVLPNSAVLTTAGKLLIHEQSGNAFVSAWNKDCTKSGGDDIADYLRNSGII